MAQFPCKKCPGCGLYHDLTAVLCSCGADLGGVPALPVDLDNLSADQTGQLNPNVPVYVQKCSACGALNFTPDPDKRVKTCHNCHKARVATVVPVAFEAEPAPAPAAPPAPEPVRHTGDIHIFFDDEDDEEDEDDAAQWQDILGNIQRATGSSEPAPAPTAPVCRDITLTAVRYGDLTFTVQAQPGQSYLLGRSAEQQEFLCRDIRVSNRHCYLNFRGGCWYVKDNHSSNGTAVNSRDIGLDGECILQDGDLLTLGHHGDSMAFRVRIG